MTAELVGKFREAFWCVYESGNSSVAGKKKDADKAGQRTRLFHAPAGWRRGPDEEAFPADIIDPEGPPLINYDHPYVCRWMVRPDWLEVEEIASRVHPDPPTPSADSARRSLSDLLQHEDSWSTLRAAVKSHKRPDVDDDDLEDLRAAKVSGADEYDSQLLGLASRV